MTTGADIQVESLRKTYPFGDKERLTAVEIARLSLPGGQATALMGASGSGKSTLLHLLGAIEAPDSGRIRVGSTEVTALRRKQLTAYRRSIGFVFQRYNLLPALTALDNVLAPVLPFRTSYDKVRRARELLRSVDLAGREHSIPSRLSGGQQQRVAIARALINSPTLILADEPTGNLDSRTGEEILTLLLGLRDEHDTTLVIATHANDVATACDLSIHLTDGHMTDTDKDADPLPADEATARSGGTARRR